MAEGIDLSFGEERLRRLIRDERDADWPFPGATDEDVRGLHERIGAALVGPLTTVEEQLDDYGSGYASHKQFWVFSRDELGTAPGSPGCSRGPGTRLVGSEQTSQRVQVLAGSSANTPDWNAVTEHVRSTLDDSGFRIVRTSVLDRSLWFAADINTLWADPPYTIRDAIFHWMD